MSIKNETPRERVNRSQKLQDSGQMTVFENEQVDRQEVLDGLNNLLTDSDQSSAKYIKQAIMNLTERKT